MHIRIQAIVCMLIIVIGLPTFALDFYEDIKLFPECKYCGMKRQNFAFSRMVVSHVHGKEVGVCSINCAALDYVSKAYDEPVGFKVADFHTKKLIDAKKACWVLGGDEIGVMAERAKWAFDHREAAEKFVSKHGGDLITFDRAMQESYVDMFADMMKLKLEKQRYEESRGLSSRRNREN